MSSFVEACRLQIAGCTVIVTVGDDAPDRQQDVRAALQAATPDLARLAVAALRRAAPPEDDEPWAVVGDSPAGMGSAAAAATTMQPSVDPADMAASGSPAWRAAVKASGGPPPRVAGGAWEAWTAVQPPPPPPKVGAAAGSSSVGGPPPAPPEEAWTAWLPGPPPPPPANVAPPTGAAGATNAGPALPRAAAAGVLVKAVPTHRAAMRTPPASAEHWDERLAYAEQHGAEVADAWAAGRRPPDAAPHATPLRSRLWVALGGPLAGLYARWDQGAEAAFRQGSIVRGFPSLGEAQAFGRGAGLADLPDHR